MYFSTFIILLDILVLLFMGIIRIILLILTILNITTYYNILIDNTTSAIRLVFERVTRLDERGRLLESIKPKFLSNLSARVMLN